MSQSASVDTTPQLSSLPLTISPAPSAYCPLLFSDTLKSLTTVSVGDSLSVTVTVSVSLPVFPLGSVAVSVIVGSLRSAHVNTLCDSVTTAPQLSSALVYVDPTDTSNCPLEFKNTSSDATASTTGASLSSTTTADVPFTKLPLPSTTVSTTSLLVSAAAQSNKLRDRNRCTIPHASTALASTSPAVSSPIPLPFSTTVTLSSTTSEGAVSSTTSTTAPALFVLPFSSVTVTTTLWGPLRSLQSKLVRSTTLDATPQLSLLLAITASAVRLPSPAASSTTVAPCVVTFGAMLSTTVTSTLPYRVFPCTSCTNTVTVWGDPATSPHTLGW